MNIALIAASLILTSAAVGGGLPRQAVGAAQRAARPASSARTGEQVFATNCARCHQPPMSLSPRITGTVMMHMRVRARLSGEDERLLLKYLAP